MALGIVQAGYKNSLYLYAAGKNPEWDSSFEEWLAELTTGLELALEGSMEDTVTDSEEGENSPTEDGQADAYSERKKEWEEVLEQANVVEAMLRQMMENGLGQQKEEEKPPQKPEEETDNDFSLDGIPVLEEGKCHDRTKTEDSGGNSQFLQKDAGHGAEYLSLANGGRKAALQQQMRAICLTCETPCRHKKL